MLPVPVTVDATPYRMALGAEHSCGLLPDGSARCWGVHGQLGDGRPRACGSFPGDCAHSVTPVRVTGLPRSRELGGGPHHTCAVAESGEVWCWGRNQHGQLGDGTTEPRPAPARVRLAP